MFTHKKLSTKLFKEKKSINPQKNVFMPYHLL